jgi:hypothetical protein
MNELAQGKALERAMEVAGQLASQSPRDGSDRGLERRRR